ncbi:MAG: glycosyltransferase, partial [Lentisphaeria bacterium]|nr:glycosyltransferase [Lentisphaeria bacterium]
MADKPEVSIVIPVYNEELNLPELVKRCIAACDKLSQSYEILLVDDGSRDRSAELIEQAVKDHPGKIIGILLSTNFGQHAAVTAGLSRARGKYMVT